MSVQPPTTSTDYICDASKADGTFPSATLPTEDSQPQEEPEISSETAVNSGGAGDATIPFIQRSLSSLPLAIPGPPPSAENGPSGQHQTSFLQTLRRQNSEPTIHNDWTIPPQFSTVSETPRMTPIGYQGVPVALRNGGPVMPPPCSNTLTLDRSRKFPVALNSNTTIGGISLQSRMSPWHYSNRPEVYSRKLFIGGLPIDIDEDGLYAVFGQFGNFEIDWPRKSLNRSFYPPKGYVFLIFDQEASVHCIMDSCYCENDKFYICISSPSVRNKPAQVRPWRLSDADYTVDPNLPLDPRKSIYLTGIPRPITASELVITMEKLFKGVCYAGIDMDPGLKYPTGAGRVAFRNRENYIAALSVKFVHLHHGDMDRQALVTPYILDNQPCDVCWSAAPYFCVHVSCLQYFCDACWSKSHSRPGFESHKPTVKEVYEKNRIAKAKAWKANGGTNPAAF